MVLRSTPFQGNTSSRNVEYNLSKLKKIEMFEQLLEGVRLKLTAMLITM
jgi:hypothetical protein